MKRVSNRPPGISSRVRPAKGVRSRWAAPNGTQVDLPVIVDHVKIHADSGECLWSVEARVDLVEGKPRLIDIRLAMKPWLDTVMLQRFFRWNSPVEIVCRMIPNLLERGIDPYAYEYPTEGFPDAVDLDRKPTHALSNAFLEEVVRQYLEIGRGYARVIAEQRGVSERTVVSWIQRARKQGILSPVRAGQYGGRFVPKAERQRE